MAGNVIEHVLRIKADGATKALSEVQAAATGAAESVSDVGTALATVGKGRAGKAALDDTARQLNHVAHSGKMLRFQFADIGTTLAGGMNPLVVFAQQGPDIAYAFQGVADKAAVLRAAFGSLGPALGILGAAAVAIGVPMRELNQTMEREIALTAFLRDVNDSLEPSIRKLEAAKVSLAVATGALTAAQGREIQMSLAAQSAVEDFARKQRDQRAEIQESIASAKNWKAALEAVTFGTMGAGIMAATDALMDWSETIEDGEYRLRSLDTALVSEAATQKEMRQALQDAAMYQDLNTAAKKRATSQSRELAEAERDLASAFREAFAYLGGDQSALAGDFAGAIIDAGEKAAEAAAKVESDAKAANRAEDLAAMRAGQARLTQWAEEQARAAEQQAARMREAIRDGMAAGASILQGSIIEAFEGFGRLGAGTSAVLGGLSGLGTDGAAGVAESLRSEVQSIVAGIEALPALLPELVKIVAVEFPVALIEALPMLVESLVAAAPQVLAQLVVAVVRIPVALAQAAGRLLVDAVAVIVYGIREAVLWIFSDGPRAIARGVAEWFREVWADIRSFFKSIFSLRERGQNLLERGKDVAQKVASVFTGESYAKAGHVVRSGLAWVDAGERITPRRGSDRDGRVSGGNSSVALTLNTPIATPDLVRQVAREFERLYGRGGPYRSTMFAGA